MMIKGAAGQARENPMSGLCAVVYLVSVDLDYEVETDIVKKEKEEKFGTKD